MNIGLIIGQFPPDEIGGAELQAKQLATELAQRNHQVTVFTRRHKGRPYRQKQDGYLIQRRTVVPIPLLRLMWDTLWAAWSVARFRPRLHVLLCYQTLNSGLAGAISQMLSKTPMVLSVRGNREYRLKNSNRHNLLVPPVFKHAQRIIVQSNRIKEEMYQEINLAGQRKLASSLLPKTVVIPNGIAPATVEPGCGGKIVYVGRLIKDKGVADLIEGMKQLPQAQLLIVGDGPDRPRLEKLARGLPITFMGFVEPAAVFDYLKQARVLVLPSHLGDGFPNVIMEAMNCGVPVVATATAGIPDLVRHAETGYLYEAGDINQMVTYINQIIKDDALWQKLSRQSLKTVQTYWWDVVTPQVEQLLEAVYKESQTKN